MEELERRRRRALYRCNHRGTKEMDLVLGKYAESKIPLMEFQEIELFEKFLQIPDPTIDSWVLKGEQSPETDFSALVEDIRKFHKLETEQRP